MAKQEQKNTQNKGAVKPKKKAARSVLSGIAHIKSTFNNTIVTITDASGNVISWSSAGKEGFKGSRKSTPYAAQVAATNAIKQAMISVGMQTVELNMIGPGAGKEGAARAIANIIAQGGHTPPVIRDLTAVPHNGCRPRKRRRV